MEYILGIESSCDETSVAVVADGRKILSNVISTQIETHKQFGGVVPEIASRMHTEAINTVYKPEDTSSQNVNKNIDSKKKKDAYLSQSLSRYSKKEQKLIGNIYDIIKKILPQETAELVIKKIQEELK